MIKQFYYLVFLIAILMLMHSIWTLLMLRIKPGDKKHTPRELFRLFLVLVSVLLIHSLEAGIFAIFYTVEHALPNFETAMYFSLTSYATVGYGDVLLPMEFRLTGAAEGLIGTLMVSWTVAVLIRLFQKTE
ncbi:potassium channel family protein [Mangrovibacter yixingensis]|uniref:potassium channel family protein n=1 Tax=Mangrovibacter yixingensis TaxID=1529639 RepID=UPI001CFE49B1|nr:potassium channel family protein [Mangrovibacter yixingensis]